MNQTKLLKIFKNSFKEELKTLRVNTDLEEFSKYLYYSKSNSTPEWYCETLQKHKVSFDELEIMSCLDIIKKQHKKVNWSKHKVLNFGLFKVFIPLKPLRAKWYKRISWI